MLTMGTVLPSFRGRVGICIVRVARDRKHVQFKVEDGGGMNEGTKMPRVFVRSWSKTARELNVVRISQEGANNDIMTA